jgi:membrane protein involved in colicin uptake
VPTIMESKHILKSTNLSKLFVAQNMLFKLFLDQLEAAELKEEAALAATAVDPGEAERRAGEEAARLAAEAAARRKAELEAQRKAAEEEAARRAAEEEEKRKADELARLLAEEALANADGLETDVTPEADAGDDDEDLEPQIRRLIKKYPILLFQNAHDPEAAGK